MWLQICQLIIIFYTTANTLGKELKTNGRTNNQHVPTQHLSTNNMKGPKNLVIQDLFGNKDRVNLETRERNPEENRVAKFSLLQRQTHEGKRHSQGALGAYTHRGNKKNLYTPQRFLGKKSNIPEQQNSKKFWNFFIYNLNAPSEDSRHPVKTQEIQQEVCKTIPFSQNITHENCDGVEIQNNLCFGKCNSLHVPNQREELNICSHCQPFKYRMNHLRLNCVGSSSVLKVVMIVEECKCVVHKHSNSGTINSYGYQ